MKQKDLVEFFDTQIKEWELADKNFKALKNVKKKYFKIEDLEGFIQFNPFRAVSTLAKVDKEEIKKRECFLCKHNRPSEQKAIEIIQGWELLINPFPILPYHFTIAGKNHIPQKFDSDTGYKLAEALPGMVVFYNDDGAGASAPDHIHFQAVPQDSLPLIQLLKKQKDKLSFPNLPYYIETDIKSNENIPRNIFIWKQEDEVRLISIPRKKHRPSLFYLNSPERRAVSPGAIDMAGVIVTPFEEDFNSLSLKDIKDIYHEVSFS